MQLKSICKIADQIRPCTQTLSHYKERYCTLQYKAIRIQRVSSLGIVVTHSQLQNEPLERHCQIFITLIVNNKAI